MKNAAMIKETTPATPVANGHPDSVELSDVDLDNVWGGFTEVVLPEPPAARRIRFERIVPK